MTWRTYVTYHVSSVRECISIVVSPSAGRMRMIATAIDLGSATISPASIRGNLPEHVPPDSLLEGDLSQEVFLVADHHGPAEKDDRRWQPIAEPPRAAEFCLSLLLSGAKSESLIGCLNERFERDCAQFGSARARHIYWGQALKSLWPLLRRAMGRALKWGALLDAARRYFGA